MADDSVSPEGEFVGIRPEEMASGSGSIMTRVEETFSVMMQQRSGNALVEKFTDDHIDKIIDGEHDDRKHGRMFHLLSLIACGVIFLLLCWLFLGFEKAEFITPIITAILGAGAGFGIGRYTAKS